MSEERIKITITRQENYRFVVDFSPAIDTLTTDEPSPLGKGAGPSPVHLLAAAVANCLSASFIFACNKFKEDPGQLAATATCEIDRNERNRLRVQAIRVDMRLGAPASALSHLDRVLAQFEDFCTVSQSVKAGIPYAITITDSDGRAVK